MDSNKLGWVRFHVPANKTYDSLESMVPLSRDFKMYNHVNKIPLEFVHDIMEKNTMEWKLIEDDGLCKKCTKNGTVCTNKANTFTNGHWTCKKHASHISIPTETFIQKTFNECDKKCVHCDNPIDHIDDFCVTSCNHVFHKQCLFQYISKQTHILPDTLFNCPRCYQELQIFGLHLRSELKSHYQYDMDTFSFSSTENESMDEFIDEYMKTHDTSFILE